MTDKELLEVAAKAAGIEFRPGGSYRVMGVGETGMPHLEKWNPLEDDGDALRLAVKLNMLFPAFERLRHFLTLERFSRQGDNDATATRRAIVRVAAEIGKAMK